MRCIALVPDGCPRGNLASGNAQQLGRYARISISQYVTRGWLSDVFGGGGYDSPDGFVSCPGGPFLHRLPGDVPFAQYSYGVGTGSTGTGGRWLMFTVATVGAVAIL
jgi:hypothetical protein